METIVTLSTALLFLLGNTTSQMRIAASASPVGPQRAATPGPRGSHWLVYDEQLRRVVLVDGYPSEMTENQPELTELWSWDGKRWAQTK